MVDRPGFFVEPTIVSGLAHDAPVVRSECFAPIVYALRASSVQEAFKWNNEVDQGLSSSLFTQSISNVFDVSEINNKYLKTKYHLKTILIKQLI